MIALLALFGAMVAQDTTGLSPKAVAMIAELPRPRPGQVSIVSRFNTDRAWVGQQVELLVATWFPRNLRERLRRQPTLRGPTLAGLWSAPGNSSPVLAETRRIGGEVYDLFVSHETLFPLTPGTVVAPPAVLSFSVPSSKSFFAPEERRSLESRPISIEVMPIPSRLAGELEDGPTAGRLSIHWRVPTGVGHVAMPITVELVVSGAGNVALWPVPQIGWPDGVRVYDEPVRTEVHRRRGIVAGEKSFRFTMLPDSAGVLHLPRVAYPWFDPGAVRVNVARAEPVDLVVQPALPAADRPTIGVATGLEVPPATMVVRRGWPLLLLLALLPIAIALWRRRPRRPEVYVERRPDRLDELRRLIGPQAAETPAGVELALRRRGVTATEARAVRDWLAGMSRHRWGHDAPMPPGGDQVDRVLQRLQQLTLRRVAPLALLIILVPGIAVSQWQQGIDRFEGGDAAGAARFFAEQAELTPAAPAVWLNLGAARFLGGDDVGAAAAWLQGLYRSPRDPRLRSAFQSIPQMPSSVTQLAPLVPLGRVELVLVALAAWLGAWLLWRRRRRLGLTLLVFTVVVVAMAMVRTDEMNSARALVRSGIAIRISPVNDSPEVTTVQSWSTVAVEEIRGDWRLVRTSSGRLGWIPSSRLASLSRID